MNASRKASRGGSLVGLLVAAACFAPAALGRSTTALDIVFTDPVNISNTATLSQSARVAVDIAGTINVAWEEAGATILFSRSTDGGRTFAPPLEVVPFHPDFSPGQVSIAATGDGTVHITWTDFEVVFGGAEIAYSRSSDGVTFAPLRIVSRIDFMNSYASSITTDGVDRLGVVWDNDDLELGATSIELRRSPDRGTTFLPKRPRVLSSVGNVVCPSVAMLGARTMYVVWAQIPGGLMFSRSLDGGATFSFPVDIAREPLWCPLIAVDAGSIYVAREEGPSFGGFRKVLVYRSGHRKPRFAPTIASQPTVDAFCPALAAGGDGRVYVTWSAHDSQQNVETFLSMSSDGGVTFSTPIVIPGIGKTAGCPQITAPGDRIHFVWHETPPGGTWTDIFYRDAVVLNTAGGQGTRRAASWLKPPASALIARPGP